MNQLFHGGKLSNNDLIIAVYDCCGIFSSDTIHQLDAMKPSSRKGHETHERDKNERITATTFSWQIIIER